MKSPKGEESLRRLRRICASLPAVEEKLSHGEPTFFTKKRVFAMFANEHHHDGHIAVYVPAPPGHQEALIAASPDVYFRPPYVGGAGWVAIEIDRIGDEELAVHIREGWEMIQAKAKRPRKL